ncbi:P-loop containing nucleoside triphosphate hydrolase protein [Irpex lacteus]|nr:P-loop containing nucleoside triphosphate hydrolase protein [Irpex lacteus]
MFTRVAKPVYSRCNTVRKLSSDSSLKIFSDPRSAEFLAAAATVESLPTIGTRPPEVRPITHSGRANVGKSTLLNAVLGRRNLLHTSKKAGRTQTLNFYRVGPDPAKAVVVDAPGYGQRGRPEWGALFDHYVSHREELKRIYLLINASHGLKESDLTMLSHLNTQCTHALAHGRPVTLQAIFTKCDLLLRSTSGKEGQKILQRMQDEVFEAAPLCLPGIVTAASGGGGGALVGVEKVRRSVVEAWGLGRVSTPVVRRTQAGS